MQVFKPLAFALDRFNADTAPNGLQDKFASICTCADIDKRNYIWVCFK